MTRSNSRCLFLCDFTASGSLCIPPPHQTRHCLQLLLRNTNKTLRRPSRPPARLPLQMQPPRSSPPGQTSESVLSFINGDIKAKTDTTSRGRRSPAEGRRCLAAVSSPPLSSSGPNYPTSDVSLSSRHPLRLHSWPHAELTRVTRCAGVSTGAAALIKEGHWRECLSVCPSTALQLC